MEKFYKHKHTGVVRSQNDYNYMSSFEQEQFDEYEYGSDLQPKEQSMVDALKKHLDSITQEEFDKEWAEIEAMGFGGPTVDEFVDNMTGQWENHVIQLLISIDEFVDESSPLRHSSSYLTLKKRYKDIFK